MLTRSHSRCRLRAHQARCLEGLCRLCVDATSTGSPTWSSKVTDTSTEPRMMRSRRIRLTSPSAAAKSPGM